MISFEENFTALVEARLNEADAEAFLIANAAAVSVADLRTACRILQAAAIGIETPNDAIDVCGTGGDAKGTLNISTAVAVAVAALGVPVAKHGNRAATSQSGATDVLDALGIGTDLSPDAAMRQLRRLGITFLAAPNYHPVLVRLAPLRRKIGRRTIFNLLGPLLNPGRVRRQLVGVYAPEWTRPMAEVLRDLGSERVWIVNGEGLDEITLTGPTQVTSLDDGVIETWNLDPRDHGIAYAPLTAIQGGTPEQNAAALVRLFEGETGAYRDIVCLNAAAALTIAGKAADFTQGLSLCRSTLDNGAALTLLRALQQEKAQ